MKEHSLLNERYRPTKLENFVGNEGIKNTISKQLSQNDIQNLIFSGAPGTGKTTLAKIIINTLDCEHLYINSSDENGIDVIRNKISKFASQVSFKPLKVVVLDEADFLTLSSQSALRNIIETYSRNTRFIMTCNFIERILDPLQSRCQNFDITPPSKPEFAQHLKKILDKEQIKFNFEDLKLLTNQNFPDLRKSVNLIQSSTVDNKLQLDKSTLFTEEYMNFVKNELLKEKPNFKSIRQIIADSNTNSFDNLFRFLYEKLDEYLPNHEGMATIIINEHSYKSSFVIDQEINCLSCIYKLIQLKK